MEFQIPFGKFNNEESTIDVLQFEPEKGVYMKLPITLDSRNRLLKFQSDIGGAFAFVKSQKSVSPLGARLCEGLGRERLVLDHLDRRHHHSSRPSDDYRHINDHLLQTESNSIHASEGSTDQNETILLLTHLIHTMYMTT